MERNLLKENNLRKYCVQSDMKFANMQILKRLQEIRILLIPFFKAPKTSPTTPSIAALALLCLVSVSGSQFLEEIYLNSWFYGIALLIFIL